MENSLCHVIQQGNRKQQVFFEDEDYQAYLELLAQFCPEGDLQVWAYSLLPNHVHLVLAAARRAELRKTIGKANRLYRRRINFRTGSSGRLWQGQMSIFPLRNDHLAAVVRFIETEPVRIRLAATAATYPWSSARAHLAGKDDRVVVVEPLLKLAPDWGKFLAEGETCGLAKRFRSQERRAGMLQRFNLSGLMYKVSGRTPFFHPALKGKERK